MTSEGRFLIVMSGFADLYFVAWHRSRVALDRRFNGYLLIPHKGFACEACSGSSSLYPLPEGRYVATNFRERNEAVMTREGVGFSVDLSDKFDPAIKRTRSLLRIHPDGGLPGTEACIGILSQVDACRNHLRSMFSDPKATRSLVVTSAADKRFTSLVFSLIKSLVVQ